VHADRRQDTELLGTRAVDLILSGHDHDLLINFDGRNALVESSYDARYVTAVDITIDVKIQDGKRVATWWPQFRIIDTATVKPDRAVASAVSKFERELSKGMDVPLGTTAVELDSRNATVRTGEAAIGNLIADAMRASLKADVAVVNGGGIRAGKVYRPGTAISRRDILAELPFGNRLVLLEMSGADLLHGIENGLSQLPNASGRFPQVSGMTVEADVKKPAGNRIISMRVGDAPIDLGRTYRVASNDFMGRGGDDYATFRDAVHPLPDDDSALLANEVMAHIRRLATIRTAIEGRIVLK
jgi:5'-nucleotidase/UDP-sugar diphosphatase